MVTAFDHDNHLVKMSYCDSPISNVFALLDKDFAVIKI